MIDHLGQVGVVRLPRSWASRLNWRWASGDGVQVLLEGAGAFQVEVPGAVDRPEAALTEQLDDAVAVVQDVTRVKRHIQHL